MTDITPTQEEETITTVGDREIEMLKIALKGVHDDGYVIFAPSKPATEFMGYMQQTLPTEMLMLLDPDFREKQAAGMYPELQQFVFFIVDRDADQRMWPDGRPVSRCFATQEEAMAMAQMMGLIRPEMVPQVDPVTEAIIPASMPPPVSQMVNFWWGLTQLGWFEGGGVFEWEQRDFIRLWNEYGRRMEAASA